jgi:uncharacterized paraquat-inducible protein A
MLWNVSILTLLVGMAFFGFVDASVRFVRAYYRSGIEDLCRRRCPHCQYILAGNDGALCPECGTVLEDWRSEALRWVGSQPSKP